jgi:hypothetical protein
MIEVLNFELVNNKYLFLLEKNKYRNKTNRMLLSNTDIDSVRKAKRYISRNYKDQLYILTEVIEKSK